MADDAPHSTADSPDATQLAVERTLLAHERTLMAWVRTTMAMITLGFSLYKFFFYLRELEPERHVPHAFGIRAYGLAMIATGVVSLAIAIWQHRRDLKRLRAHYPDAPSSLATWLALLIVGLGVLAFGAVVFQQ